MFFFVIFLFFVCGLILINSETYFFSIILLVLAITISFVKYRKEKNRLIVFLVIFLLGLGKGNINFNSFQKNSYIGLVIDKKDNYFILYDGLEKFYVPTKEKEITNFSLVRVEGNPFDYNFSTIESGFNFNKYLKNKGIRRGLSFNKYKNIIKNPLNLRKYKNKVLSYFSSNDAKAFVSSLLFGEADNDSSIVIKAKSLQIINLISLTGIFINFLLYGFMKLLFIKFSKKTSTILSLITFLPLLMFSITKFSTIRVIYFYILSFLNNNVFKKRISRLKIVSLSGFLFLLLNKFLIFQTSFIIPFFLYFIFCFLAFLFSKYKKIKLFIVKRLVLFFILVPFFIISYQSINPLNLIMNIILTPVFKLMFLVCVLSFYGIFLPFYNNIFTFFFEIIRFINIEKLSINIPPLNQYLVVFYYLILMLILFFMEIRYKKPIFIFSVVLTSFLIIYSIPLSNYKFFEISYINVGQGDATLIRNNQDVILIDTGGLLYQDLATQNLIPFLKKKRLYRINSIFLTHNDYDHIGALVSLKKNFRIDNIYDNKTSFPAKICGLSFTDLNKYKDFTKEENYNSRALILNYLDKSFLFMGDCPKEVENQIILDNPSLKIDYLKVGHHGSNTSTSDKFIKTIKPKEAIISCGLKNKYHHPNKETLEILEKYNVKIRRTDLEGTITYNFEK